MLLFPLCLRREMEETQDLTWKCPWTAILAGSTGSGKTTFVKKLLEHANGLYDRPPGPVYFFYKVWQPLFAEIDATFTKGICTMEWIQENVRAGDNCTLIMDDLARDMTSDTAEIFAVASHHYDCNVLLVVHNLFEKNIHFRKMVLNTKYQVIFKNPRDRSSATHFAKQFDPGHGTRFMQIYDEATAKPYSYLLGDFDQSTPEDFRLRSNIFMENDTPMSVFVRL